MAGAQRPQAAQQHGQRKQKRDFLKKLNRRSGQEHAEIADLDAAIAAGAPLPGTNPLTLDKAVEGTYAGARNFEEMPISTYTQDGLKSCKYVRMTAIQRAALPHAIAGRDVLGAAKTGSGKTLAFLVPLVEKLYRMRWTRRDGLGALVLTPTRELALQIFEELKKVGQHHDMSAGLLIGGKDVKAEQASVGSMNILVATPGRLLQHMDETPGFDAANLQMLVLDEADRILDMGFADTLDAILANLPRQRQTMLFSATQTKSVKSLARLSLSDPEYLAVHEHADQATPLKLDQAYAVVDLSEKMDVVWSFVKAHLHAKTIVFLSTCKQVRFVYEAFRRLRPGVPVRALHGSMKQMKRMGVYYEFCEAKRGDGMVLFATDVAARGLDVPTVDWVLQMDCPEDAAAYIHRVGRTARYMSAGRALLLLTPSEKDGMLSALADAKVPIKQIRINPKKATSVGPALQSLLSKSVELKEFAQRSLVAYVRSVFLQPNKRVFDVAALPVADYAISLGLPTAPKLRFLKKTGKRVQAIEVGGSGRGPLEEEAVDEQGGRRGDRADGPADGADATHAAAGPSERKRKRAAAVADDAGAAAGKDAGAAEAGGRGGAAEALGGGGNGSGDDGDDDNFMTVKTRDVFGSDAGGGNEVWARIGMDGDGLPSAAKGKKKLKIKESKPTGSRVVFDEEGTAVDPLALLARSELGIGDDDGDGNDGDGTGMYVVKSSASDRFAAAASLLKTRDREDKARLKAIRQELKMAEKARQRARAAAEAAEAAGGGAAVLGSSHGGSSDSESEPEGAPRDGHTGTQGEGSDSDGDGDRSSGSDGGDSDDSRGGVAPAYRELAKQRKQTAHGAGEKGGAAAKASLADQEALALRLLASKK